MKPGSSGFCQFIPMGWAPMRTKVGVSTEEGVLAAGVLCSQPTAAPHWVHMQPLCAGAGGWPPGEQVAPWGLGWRGLLQRFLEPQGPSASSGET